MFFARLILLVSCLGLTVAVIGCSGSSVLSKAGKFYDKDGPPDASHAFSAQEHTVLKIEKPYKAANRPYTVMGKRYYPMSGDRSFSQTGVASWYGKQFHGRKTAIGERYDMFAMTAAHPTMELPSYARVTNLKNGKSLIVRVNDRGPFLGGRIIDMSYAAAVKLGYHTAGTARVKVERITRREIASGNYRTDAPKTQLTLADPVKTAPRIEPVIQAQEQQDTLATVASAPGSVPSVSDTPILSSIPSAESNAPSDATDAAAVSEITESPVIDIGTTQRASEETDESALKQTDAIATILNENVSDRVTGGAPTAPMWSIQIGAFSNETNAREAAAHAEMMLSEHDITARVRVVSDAKLHRVLIGSVPTRAAAQALCESIALLLGIRAFIIQR